MVMTFKPERKVRTDVYEAVTYSLNNTKDTDYDMLKYNDEDITNDLMEYDASMEIFQKYEILDAVKRYRKERS